jgi:hypothetical protein
MGRLARRIASRMALVLFGLCIALLLGEVLVRIFGHEGPVYTFRDPVIGRRYTRSWEGDVWNEEAGRVVHVRFNREGMRDRDWPEAPAAGASRIAILGDSMVAALGVDEEKTFPKLVQARLQTLEDAKAKEAGREPRRIEVMNWGVQGSSPALQSVLYEQRVRRYRPNLVVTVFFTGNDFSDDWQPIGGRRQGWGEVRPDGSLEHEPFGGSECSVSEWLARNSRLYVWQKRVLSRIDDDGHAGLRPGLRIFDLSSDPELGRAWRFQEAIEKRIRSLVVADGSQYRAVLLPCSEEIHDDLWATVAAKAATFGWRFDRFWDLNTLAPIKGRGRLGDPEPLRPMYGGVAEALLQAVDRRPSTDSEAQVYLNGTGHLNERGHQVVSDALAPHLFEIVKR